MTTQGVLVDAGEHLGGGGVGRRAQGSKLFGLGF